MQQGANDDLIATLRKSISGDVDDGKRRRAEYSTDASNYRIISQAVVFPKSREDVAGILEVAGTFLTSVTMRGAGTSIAGNAIGSGIVVDTSRYFNRILEFDPVNRRARVEPGVILGEVQKAGIPHGLRFGPDPSTWARCSLGGMIGNNACGPHSLAFGKTAENILSLDVIDGLGRAFKATEDLQIVPGLNEFLNKHEMLIRKEFGRFGRQISGYSLQYLLSENGSSLAKTLVGTEGTCVLVQEAEIALVPLSKEPVLIVLGYSDMPSAADAVMKILEFRPDAIEGLDSRLVDAVRQSRGRKQVAELPTGSGWLLVEISGANKAEVLNRAEKIVRGSDARGSKIVTSAEEMKSLWRIREDGVGLAGRTTSGRQTWPGFEDAAVPPKHLGNYLREFDQLLAAHGFEGMSYGHFGEGCLHLRIDFPLKKRDSGLRSFMEDAAHLVAKFGGSLSGEHGDGRARSELLPIMYSPQAIKALQEFKNLFDPENLLNPGIIVQPASLDADLRRTEAREIIRPGGLAFLHDQGDFTKSIHRCVGIGKCRVDNQSTGDFMCPSYLATKDEKDSTRGRARVLQEMTNGGLVKDGWKSAEVEESLDLCLSCKACSSDCPAGVDMAAYKSEFLFQKFKGKRRPLTHYSLGWLPQTAHLMAPLASVFSRVFSIRGLEKAALFLGGMDTRRHIPRFSTSRLRSSAPSEERKKVLLWSDTFSVNFASKIGIATKQVLESAGYDVLIPEKKECCGLTLISTGQLPRARKSLLSLLDSFSPFVEKGIPIVGIEPSCIAVLRSDLKELLPEDSRSDLIASNTYTLAEILQAPAPLGPGALWRRPALDGLEVLVQPHCHQHAVMGFSVDQNLLHELGAEIKVLGGCCGLAGNFGMEKGHYETSVAVAENSLLPALRAMKPGTVFLADGFSCRTQASQLGAVEGLHLAQLLAQRGK
ncbi:MAG: FAD-binding oxidoreductase [Actinobacteria bacterium]|nr:FAD-binding oxidoreductase [Actinomycetota bacterium]